MCWFLNYIKYWEWGLKVEGWVGDVIKWKGLSNKNKKKTHTKIKSTQQGLDDTKLNFENLLFQCF